MPDLQRQPRSRQVVSDTPSRSDEPSLLRDKAKRCYAAARALGTSDPATAMKMKLLADELNETADVLEGKLR